MSDKPIIPGSPEWHQRVNKMLAEEKNPPGVWYMSFASEVDGWLGGCFVKAKGPTSAMQESHARGCNPGGSIKTMYAG